MARDPCKKELFISSCLSAPPWVDDMMRRVREAQERRYLQEMCGVPVYKVSTETFDIELIFKWILKLLRWSMLLVYEIHNIKLESLEKI